MPSGRFGFADGQQALEVAVVRVLEDLPSLDGRSVLLRADVNVPLEDGQITDDFRIRSSMETLCWLLKQGAEVELCGHLGRPKGQVRSDFSLEPVERRLRELLESKPEVKDCQRNLAVRENLRFDPRETANDETFVRELIAGHDCYVNDAFGASHRAHASIVGPPQFLPSCAGRLLAQETEVLTGLREHPKRPFVAVLGGSKVSDKLGVVTALAELVDQLVIGGAMAFTFLAAQGYSVGNSLFEPDFVDDCRRLLDSGSEILLPTDLVAENSSGQVKQTGVNLSEGWVGKDIGPGTAAEFADSVLAARSVFWNGPMGVFEDQRFGAGTATVAEAVNTTSAYTVIGGGDTVAAAAIFESIDQIDHISTGGGASLELLEHGSLPGLEALR